MFQTSDARLPGAGSVLSLALTAILATVACSPQASLTAAAVVNSILLSASPRVLPAGGGDSQIEATVTDAGDQPVGGIEVQFFTTAGELVPTDSVVTDAAGKAKVALRTESSATVTARAATVESAELEVVVLNAIRLDVEVTPSPPQVGETTVFEVVARKLSKSHDGIDGTLDVDFGDGKSTRVRDFTGSAEVEHKYREEGKLRVQVTFEDEHGYTTRTSLRVAPEVPQRIDLSVEVSPATPVLDEPATFTFAAVREDGSDGEGVLDIDFGDGATESVDKFAGTATRKHTYTKTGDFTVKATLSEANGRDAKLSRPLSVVEVGSGLDEIDPEQVVWLHRDVSDWPVTTRVTGVRITDSEICIFYDKAGQWPTSRLGDILIDSNPWIFARFDGVWHGATYDWNRPGQQCKHVTAEELGSDQIRIHPMDASWVPQSGDLIGLMVSGRARHGEPNVRERSNIVVVRWP